LVGNEGAVEGLGEVLEAGEFAAFHLLFFLGEDLGVEGFPVFEEVPRGCGPVYGPWR
jgi:hypothetical protein